MVVGGVDGHWSRKARTKERSSRVSTIFSLGAENKSVLTRDGTAELVSRDQISGSNEDSEHQFSFFSQN